MKEHPILFSAPMVRSILAGTKTQTRRIVKPQPCFSQVHRWKDETLYDCETSIWAWREHLWGDAFADCHGMDTVSPLLLPFAKWKVGDRLWVKETHQILFTAPSRTGRENWKTGAGLRAVYTATDGRVEYHDEDKGIRDALRPSIFMPRWASRITLEVTDVRVERVQSISEDDARAEGLRCLSKDGGRTYKHGIPDRDGLPGTDNDGWPWHEWEVDPRAAYRRLWESINGAESWAANPWVWVLGFRDVRGRK